MSNWFIYVVDAHFIDKIEEQKISWTQVPVGKNGKYDCYIKRTTDNVLQILLQASR